ncbi:ResB protein required for cytochrome c biosynthesis [Desulfitobacterium dehalogenans ATCC 51507]|uniref:ResB protein required for cytochrome c biosynthesis n=2 Tax=Desulfitobacterium dehalogenans TaxID=36854 RepID=I4A6R1_DESDJ|nr:ResB protein required for cytochrome c biosynthesis [Desulfitobacterium dehalogenans ATCC 51507]
MQQMKRLWAILTSMKLGVVLLVLFTGVSMIGTFVPQESFAPEQAAQISPLWQTLGVTHLYSSVLYRIIVALVVINLLSCTIKRIPKIVQIYRHIPEHKTAAQIQGAAIRTKIELTQSPDDFQRKLVTKLDSKHYRHDFQETSKEILGWADKNRLGVWGSVLVHSSFIILVIGVVLGHWGFMGYFMSAEGTHLKMQDITLEKGTLQSDWEIEVHSAEEKFDAQGVRENWYTDMSISQGGKELVHKTVSVNSPLTYEGITFYQTFFEYGASFEATLRGEKTLFSLAEVGQSYFQATGTTLYLIIERLKMNDGHLTVDYQVLSPEREGPVQKGTIRQGEQISIQGVYDIVFTGPTNFTGLVVKKDPGVPLIWLGCGMLFLGLVLSFYLKPQTLWFALTTQGVRKGYRGSLVITLWSGGGSEHAQELLEEFKAEVEKEPKPRKIHGLLEEVEGFEG